jgi:hypothetical protein
MTRRRWAGLAIVLAASVPYLPSVDDYFVQDDFGVVWLLSQKPASAFLGWFASTWMDDIWGYTPDEIRPFPAVTYRLAALAGAGSPVANHLLNIALHAANALLVCAIGVRAAGLGLPAALLAALVFALLPAQAETVAWVTGRVDSMPALFYTGSFLAYVCWRATAARRLYVASLVLFFVALFSKQNTVTFVPAILLYDAIVARGAGRREQSQQEGGSPVFVFTATWDLVRPYLPFVALTAGFLMLRWVLFGEVARESTLNAQALELFAQMTARHVQRLVVGQPLSDTALVVPLLVAVVAVFALALRSEIDRGRAARAAAYFGVAWVALGIAPTLVSGYESTRHIYLASFGSAVAFGVAADVLWHARPRRLMRPAAALAGALVLSAYMVQLADVVRDWGVRAAVSRQAVTDLEREALAAPEGTLVVAGVSPRSWEWSLPFAARPPFAGVDVTRRVTLVYPVLLHCCRGQWGQETARALSSWARRADAPPIVVLAWDERTGALSRLTDREEPFVRDVMLALAEVGDPSAIQSGLTSLIDSVVSGTR